MLNFYVTNKFLGGKFSDYGSRIRDFYQKYPNQVGPMDDVFPKMTKCQFNKHGPGGDINVNIILY